MSRPYIMGLIIVMEIVLYELGQSGNVSGFDVCYGAGVALYLQWLGGRK